MPAGPTGRQIDAKWRAQQEFELFREEAFASGDQDLHPTAKAAALSIQCDPPDEFFGTGLTRLCCAARECANCPDFKRPELELTANDSIRFFVSLLFHLAASVAHWILKPRIALFA